ncbi:MAG: hypothetical protein HeimC3_53890 [Candidatus Heimdallarchaeota archaeon LC_3]|nr:MAG: hypothetical protein HeimC3_53890 [Candidatus Heimdallarchaeota archaeon LC_3]
MEQKKIGLKNRAQTKKGTRLYANAQTTLISHPTRLKILEVLRSGNKSTRELELETRENRMNLYYHLNLLLEEKIIKIVSTTREKIYSIEKESTDNEPVPISMKLEIPKNADNKKAFFSKLNDLVKNSDSAIPKIDILSLQIKKYNSLTFVLETEKED